MAYVLVDDLTRVEITDPEHAPTVLAVDGHAVELDLSEASAEQLRALLAPYYAAGRAPAVHNLADLPDVDEDPPEGIEEQPDWSPYPVDPDLDEVEVPDEPEVLHVTAADAAATAPEPVPDAVIRTWARKHGIDCPASRQVSSGVRAMHAAVAGGAPRR